MSPQLAEVGITTVEQLKAVGSHEAWLRILAIDPFRMYHAASPLWRAQSKECGGIFLMMIRKKSLKTFYKEHKREVTMKYTGTLFSGKRY